MEPLVLNPTSDTPRVNFNAQTGLLKIEGRSWPENSTNFYVPLIEWFDQYISSEKEKTDFYVTLEYFNSTSSKMLLALFRRLIRLVHSGSKVTIHWCYHFDDEEMLETGKEYHAEIDHPSDLFEFKFTGIEEYPV